jgi:hypothetical protein
MKISLRDLQLSVSPLQLLSHLRDFHKTWYEPYVDGGHHNVITFNILQPVKTAWRTSELMRREEQDCHLI